MTDDQIPSGVERTAATPLESVRRLETWFFGEEGFNPRRAIDYLLEEASLCGVSNVDVREVDGWWVLAASEDWLPADSSVLQIFHELARYPEGGPNGSRMEVLLTAFARAVVTAHLGNVLVIVDGEGTSRWVEEHKDCLAMERVVAFLPP